MEEVYTEHQSSIRCLLKGGPVTKNRQAFPSERSPSKLSVIISCVVWCSERGSSGRLVLCSLSLGAFLKGIYTRGRLLCSRCSLFLGALKGVPGKCLSVFAWWLVLLLQDMVCYFNVLYRLIYASSLSPFYWATSINLVFLPLDNTSFSARYLYIFMLYFKQCRLFLPFLQSALHNPWMAWTPS